MRQLVHEVGRQPQPEEMHQGQVQGHEEGVVGGIDHLMRQAAPEQAEVARLEPHLVAAHLVFESAAEHDS